MHYLHHLGLHTTADHTFLPHRQSTTRTDSVSRIVALLSSAEQPSPRRVLTGIHSLPVEIFIQVAESLSGPNLRALRDANQGARAAIDTHQKQLSRRLRQEQHHRLTTELSQLDFTDVPLDIGLRRYASHVGSPATSTARGLVPKLRFCDAYFNANASRFGSSDEVVVLAGFYLEIDEWIDHLDCETCRGRGATTWLWPIWKGRLEAAFIVAPPGHIRHTLLLETYKKVAGSLMRHRIPAEEFARAIEDMVQEPIATLSHSCSRWSPRRTAAIERGSSFTPLPPVMSDTLGRLGPSTGFLPYFGVTTRRGQVLLKRYYKRGSETLDPLAEVELLEHTQVRWK